MSTNTIREDSAVFMGRVASGDPEAVRDFIKKHGGLVWSMARKVHRQQEDAEDAVQEIFLALWKNAARFDPAKAAESTFVGMIARRRLMDRLRSSYRQIQVDEMNADSPQEDPQLQRLEVEFEASKARSLMSSLRTEQRDVITLNVFHGMSHAEIANLRKLPLGTVKTHMNRGLQRLRKLMQPQGLRSEPHVTAC